LAPQPNVFFSANDVRPRWDVPDWLEDTDEPPSLDLWGQEYHIELFRGIAASSGFGSCSMLARVLYLLLWQSTGGTKIAVDCPASIKKTLLPNDDCDCNLLLDELAARHLIRRIPIAEYLSPEELQGIEEPPAGILRIYLPENACSE
jgi:hypothetical protein